MKVKELIEELSKCPQDLDVWCHYDSAARLEIDCAYFQHINMLVLAESTDTEFDVGQGWIFNPLLKGNKKINVSK